MRTVNFRDTVLHGIAQLMGLDPRKDLRTDQLLAWATFVNLWVMKVWDKFDWPEWTIIRERTPNALHTVSFEEEGLFPLGRVHKVYLFDPREVRGPVDTPFRLSADGVHVGFDHGPTVWIKFTKRAPQFSGDLFLPAKMYPKNHVVYNPAGGNCFLSLVEDNNFALSNTAKWELVEFPYQIAEPVVKGAYSDALRDDGQTDKAMAEEQRAMQALGERASAQIAQDYDLLTDQQIPKPRYRSRANAPA